MAGKSGSTKGKKGKSGTTRASTRRQTTSLFDPNGAPF